MHYTVRLAGGSTLAASLGAALAFGAIGWRVAQAEPQPQVRLVHTPLGLPWQPGTGISDYVCRDWRQRLPLCVNAGGARTRQHRGAPGHRWRRHGALWQQHRPADQPPIGLRPGDQRAHRQDDHGAHRSVGLLPSWEVSQRWHRP